MKLNPWLAERLGVVDPEVLDVIIEVEPSRLEYVLGELSRLGIRPKQVTFGTFIAVRVPVELLPAIERIDGVTMIHYDAPVSIKPVLPLPALSDPLLGEVRPSSVEIPGIRVPVLPASPLGLGLLRFHAPDVEIIPTEQYIDRVVDIETHLDGTGVRVAVIDTGLTRWHPQFIGRGAHAESVIPEPSQDLQGHGSWCTGMVAGRWVATRFGKVGGVAYNAYPIHIKALSTLGFGRTSDIMKAMERALELGAQVVSMSLGGPQQGPVDTDPLCKAARILAQHGVIVVAAAGNDGPAAWTINSPGVCPDVLTVGSVSLLDGDEVVWFSSRGPSGEWYAEHRSDYEEDLRRYGDLLVKPDVVSYGGGRRDKNAKPDEVLYQGVTGWFDGFYDLAADMAEGMHGTCVVGDTMIRTGDNWTKIRDIKIGELVIAAKTKPDIGLAISKVTAKFVRPKSDIYTLAIDGRELWATGDHPILTVRRTHNGFTVEWMTLEQIAQLSKDELNKIRIVSMRKQPTLKPTSSIGEEMAWFLGYFLGDGWVTKMKRTYMIAIADSYNRNRRSKGDVLYAIKLAKKLFGLDMKLYTHKKGARYWRAFSKTVGEQLIELGIAGKHAREKNIPPWIFGLPSNEKRAFLEGLIAADGYCDKHGRCRIETASKALAEGIHLLAIDIGANASRVYSRTRTIKVPSTGKEKTATTYTVQVTFLPMRTYYSINFGTSSYVFRNLDGTVDIRKIKSIEYAGREVTYDITVAGFHSYVANGIIVHNSQATPTAAGVVALAKQARPDLTLGELKRGLAMLAHGKSTEYGWGVLRLSTVARAVKL